MTFEYDIRKIKRILRYAKSKISGLNSFIAISPSSNIEMEKTVSSQTNYRGTTHYHLNRTSASVQIIQRAESIIDNFIYEILEKLVDVDCLDPSLKVISAFSLAKNAPIDRTTDHSVVNIEEEWYKRIPFQFRRWVLLQHLVQLHIQNVKVPWILRSMIDACLEKDLSYQGYEILKAHWSLVGASTKENAAFIMICICTWRKQEAWFRFLDLHVTEREVEDEYFFEMMEEMYKIRLLKLLLQIIIDSVTSNKSSTLHFDRSHSHLELLNSVFQNEFQELSDLLFKVCDIMNALVHLIRLPIETAIGLLVQGIIILKDVSQESRGLWCSHLSELLIDQHIDKVINISEAQLMELAKYLESFYYYEAAIKILVFLEHKIMKREDLRETLEQCQSVLGKLKDHVKLNPGYSTKFNLRYEPMLDSWISCTPKPLQRQISDVIETHNQKDAADDELFVKPKPKIAFSHPLSKSFSPDPLIGVSKSFNIITSDLHDGLSSAGEETPMKSKFMDTWNENYSPTPQYQTKRNAPMMFSPKRKVKNISIVTPLPRNNEEDELL